MYDSLASVAVHAFHSLVELSVLAYLSFAIFDHGKDECHFNYEVYPDGGSLVVLPSYYFVFIFFSFTVAQKFSVGNQTSPLYELGRPDGLSLKCGYVLRLPFCSA